MTTNEAMPLSSYEGIGDGLARLAVEYGGLSPQQFEQSMLALCVPRGASDEIIGALIATAIVTKLNPLMQEIEVLPLGGGPKVYIRSGGWAKILNRDPRVASWKVSHLRDDDRVVRESTLVVTFKDGETKEWSIDTDEWVVTSNSNWKTRRTHMSGLRALSVGTKYCLGLNLGHNVAGDEDELQRVKDLGEVEARTQPESLDDLADALAAKVEPVRDDAVRLDRAPAGTHGTEGQRLGDPADTRVTGGEAGSTPAPLGGRDATVVAPPAPSPADEAKLDGPPADYKGPPRNVELFEEPPF